MAHRKPMQRDLTKAVTLRPRDVYNLYGIQPSMICCLCNHDDPEKRLPSRLIPGRKGRRGMRLIDHADLRAWLDRWKTPVLASSVASHPPKAA